MAEDLGEYQLNTAIRRSPWIGRTFLVILPMATLGALALSLLSPPISAEQAIVENVKPLAVMQQAKGRKLFETNCASCHGKLADGRVDLGPPLIHPFYRRGHHANIAFYRAAEKGVQAHHWPFGDMPKQPQVSRDEMTEIIAYLRDLQNANGIF